MDLDQPADRSDLDAPPTDGHLHSTGVNRCINGKEEDFEAADLPAVRPGPSVSPEVSDFDARRRSGGARHRIAERLDGNNRAVARPPGWTSPTRMPASFWLPLPSSAGDGSMPCQQRRDRCSGDGRRRPRPPALAALDRRQPRWYVVVHRRRPARDARARVGRIINTSSLAGRVVEPRYWPAYVATKSGIVGLTMGPRRSWSDAACSSTRSPQE